MKITINVMKRHLYVVTILLAVFLGTLFVIAFSTTGTGGNPAQVGHSVDEIDWSKAIPSDLEVTGKIKSSNIGGCYTAIGIQDCAPGYQKVVSGRLGGMENYNSAGSGGVVRANVYCITDTAKTIQEWGGSYYNRLMRSDAESDGMTGHDPNCAICCKGDTYIAFATTSCDSGYTAAYTGRIGGIESYHADDLISDNLCIASSSNTKFTWSSGYSTRLMRYKTQPADGGPNGMEYVNNECAVCVTN